MTNSWKDPREVQKILDRIEVKPFWWFKAHVVSVGCVDIGCHHLTVTSTKECKYEEALFIIELAKQGKIVPLSFYGSTLMVSKINSTQDFNRAVKYIENGWTLFDVHFQTGSSFWNDQGVLNVVKHLTKVVEEHELQEFLKLDGKQVVDPHPDGRQFHVPTINAEGELDER